MIGRSIAHYKIVERLGSGGMGEVWLARDAKLERDVAIKFLSPARGNDEQSRQRFLREARSVSKLSHPNIITVHEIGSVEGWNTCGDRRWRRGLRTVRYEYAITVF